MQKAPLLATIRAHREALRQRQQELQSQAALEHARREQPKPGWYRDKGPTFHRQLHRLNALDARARRGEPTLLQTLASF